MRACVRACVGRSPCCAQCPVGGHFDTPHRQTKDRYAHSMVLYGVASYTNHSRHVGSIVLLEEEDLVPAAVVLGFQQRKCQGTDDQQARPKPCEHQPSRGHRPPRLMVVDVALYVGDSVHSAAAGSLAVCWHRCAALGGIDASNFPEFSKFDPRGRNRTFATQLLVEGGPFNDQAEPLHRPAGRSFHAEACARACAKNRYGVSTLRRTHDSEAGYPQRRNELKAHLHVQ